MKDDNISRRAAIDAVECITSSMSICLNEDECHGMKRMQRQAVLELANMPSAQPEYTEQDMRDEFNAGYACGMEAAQPGEDIRAMCGECDAWNQYKNYPQPGWIPWDSGKFPKESGWYIVTAYDGRTSRTTFAKYQKRLKRWDLTGARAYWRVLAFAPLPEPYRAAGGETDGEA